LQKAVALLADPRLLIKQVAYQAGFNNAAAFSAAFRKELVSHPRNFATSASAERHPDKGAFQQYGL